MENPQYFVFYDALDKLKVTQNFESRGEYLNSKFGNNNWKIENNHFSYNFPLIVENPYSFDFSENLINKKTEKQITIVAEIIIDKKHIYIEMLNLNVNSKIMHYETRFQLLISGQSNLFVIHKHKNSEVLVSNMKKVKVLTGGPCGLSARSQEEAKKLNTELCRKAKKHKKKNHPACEAVKFIGNHNAANK
ncbi:MAG: hypothetical protein OEY36_10975 [Gammaproteobacteria bacterium]|nr:hypothetical protein [Gammaproteobacteria bacterium]